MKKQCLFLKILACCREKYDVGMREMPQSVNPFIMPRKGQRKIAGLFLFLVEDGFGFACLHPFFALTLSICCVLFMSLFSKQWVILWRSQYGIY
jgi:hypothetical protein